MKRHCSLYRLKRPSWKSSYTIISLLNLISLSYSGSLRTFVRMPLMSRKNPTFSTFFLASGSNLPFLSDYHDGSCFTFYPQAQFDQKEENEPWHWRCWRFQKSRCRFIVYITFAICIILRVKVSKVLGWNTGWLS